MIGFRFFLAKIKYLFPFLGGGAQEMRLTSISPSFHWSLSQPNMLNHLLGNHRDLLIPHILTTYYMLGYVIIGIGVTRCIDRFDFWSLKVLLETGGCER